MKRIGGDNTFGQVAFLEPKCYFFVTFPQFSSYMNFYYLLLALYSIIKSMKKIISLGLTLLGILADQLLKAWTVANIPLGGEKEFIPGILSLTYLRNEGAAWSMLEGKQWFFLILTPIVIIAALYFLNKKINQNWYFAALTLIISGALGNFIDRVRQSFVVDMFQTDFINFPIFNIADILLSIGFVVLFIAIILDKEVE